MVGDYDHLPGLEQRYWAHLWRDIDKLEREYPEDPALAAWVVGVWKIHDRATGPRSPAEKGMTSQAVRARNRRATRYEQALLHLCPDTMTADRSEATLA